MGQLEIFSNLRAKGLNDIFFDIQVAPDYKSQDQPNYEKKCRKYGI